MADISKEMAVQLAREAGGHIKPGAIKATMMTPDALERFAKSLIKLGRNAGLEEAKQELKGVTGTHPMVLRGIAHAIEIIEELEGQANRFVLIPEHLAAYLRQHLQSERRKLNGFVALGNELQRAEWYEAAIHSLDAANADTQSKRADPKQLLHEEVTKCSA